MPPPHLKHKAGWRLCTLPSPVAANQTGTPRYTTNLLRQQNCYKAVPFQTSRLGPRPIFTAGPFQWNIVFVMPQINYIQLLDLPKKEKRNWADLRLWSPSKIVYRCQNNHRQGFFPSANAFPSAIAAQLLLCLFHIQTFKEFQTSVALLSCWLLQLEDLFGCGYVSDIENSTCIKLHWA